MRIGAYELLFVPEMPASAVIDEAIELARRYGAKDSPAFVNGVLDRIARARETASAATADSTPSAAGEIRVETN